MALSKNRNPDPRFELGILSRNHDDSTIEPRDQVEKIICENEL